MKVTLEAMPEEIRDLAAPWPSLAGRIPLLTPELELDFRFGQRVIYFGGMYRFGGNIKGGSSSIWAPSDRAHYECYTRWRDRDGIPDREDRPAYDRLAALLGARGVEIVNGNYPRFQQDKHRYVSRLGHVYAVTADILSRLPIQHLGAPTFVQLQLGGWGPDSAKASAYDGGAVMMYDFALEGARRTYAGLLLHELGHAHQSLIPPFRVADVQRAFETIRRDGAVLGVEYLLDAETRRAYQLRFFEEFLAEAYLIYTTQGSRLRRHIADLDVPSREAWTAIYEVFLESFGGIEYQ